MGWDMGWHAIWEIIGWRGVRWNGMGPEVARDLISGIWDGVRWGGVGWGAMERDGMGSHGVGQGGTGRDGMIRNVSWDLGWGMGRDGTRLGITWDLGAGSWAGEECGRRG